VIPVRLVAVLASALLGLSLAVGALAASAPNPALTAALLRASQVGHGYRLLQRPDGHGTKSFVTLDVCGFVFPSEKLRTDRIQVNYESTPQAIVFSNEVVTYKPGKAPQAMGEVRYAVAHCPKKARPNPYFAGRPISYRLKLLKDSRLAPGYVALQTTMSATVKGKLEHVTLIAVYQTRGNVLSAIYAYPAKGTSTAALRRAAFHAAEAAGRNLAPAA
jgi:hypothetical protein